MAASILPPLAAVPIQAKALRPRRHQPVVCPSLRLPFTSLWVLLHGGALQQQGVSCSPPLPRVKLKAL